MHASINRKLSLVEGISMNKNGQYIIATNNNQNLFDSVVIATPANEAARLIRKLDKDLYIQLTKVRYFPVGIVIEEYKEPVFSENRRALTFSKESALNNAGAYGVSKLNIVHYTFSGMASRSLLNTNPSIDTLLKIAEKEAMNVLNLDRNELLGHTGVVLKTGLCAYSLDHGNTLSEINRRLNSLPGIFLSGDYIEGVSIEACCLSGIKAAKNVFAYLKQSNTDLQGMPSAVY